MSTAETLLRPLENGRESADDREMDRRADVDFKQARVAALLREADCEGLLLLEPENVGWITSGATTRGILNPAEFPAVYCNAEQRWAISANADSQRLFDEEIDGLGFQLKEWPWHRGREQLLTEWCRGRQLACDRARGEAKVIADSLRHLRLTLTDYEQACYRALGQVVGHALEATCRTMDSNESEREIAGQLSHRLIRRGAQPVQIGVAADGRSRLYRRYGFTAMPVRDFCVLSVTARKYGFNVTASRSVCFGTPNPTFRQEHDAACRVSATYIASSWPDAVPREVLGAGRRVYQISGFEHEWQSCPQGHISGRLPVELELLPQAEDLFQAGWAVTWHASVGAASSCDTFLITEQGPRLLTPTEAWPLKRIRIQGADFVRPDILQR